MREIIFWGGTGLAKVLNEAISNIDFTLAAIFDNRDIPSPLPPVPLHVGRAGFDAWFKARGGIAAKPLWFSVAIGAKGRDRLDISRRLVGYGLELATIAHPTAWVASDARIGPGAQLLAGSKVASRTRIGHSVIVNTGASVDHSCVIGDCVHIAPGAILTGELVVEDGVFVGAGAIILPRLRIGADAMIGAGAVVTRDVPNGATVIGNPARPIALRG